MQASLPSSNITVSALDLCGDTPEIQGSITEVARHKAYTAASNLLQSHKDQDGKVPEGSFDAVITDDTALEISALGGMPGVYVKHFVKAIGADGIERMLHGFDDRAATAVCCFGLAVLDSSCSSIVHTDAVVGTCQGSIQPQRVDAAFGWDPIFAPSADAQQRTFAQMSAEEKNEISHRTDALNKLQTRLDELL